MRDPGHLPHRLRTVAAYAAAACVAVFLAACGAAEPTPTPVPSVEAGPEASGRVLVLAVSPAFASDQTVFAGTEHAGVLKSTDGGRTWKQVNQGIYDGNVPAIAVSPGFGADRTVFAGTRTQGLFLSTDGGETWSQTGEGLPDGNVPHLSSATTSGRASPPDRVEHRRRPRIPRQRRELERLGAGRQQRPAHGALS